MKILRLNQAVIMAVTSLFCLCTACEDDLKEDSSSSGSISVNGFLSPQDTFRINISYLKSMWGYVKDSFVTDAKVQLILPDQSVQTMEYDSMKYLPPTWKKKGFYKAPALIPYYPGLYTLQVETAGNKTIIARDSIPAPVPLTGCSLILDTVQKKCQLQIRFSDPPERENYYAVSVNETSFDINGGSGTHDNIELSSPNTFIEAPVGGPLDQLVFSDKTFDTGTQIVDILTPWCYGNPYGELDSIQFDVQLHSISKAYYDYSISFYKQNQAEKDFYAEPVSVYSNTEGGYGIFAGYSTSTLSATFRYK